MNAPILELEGTWEEVAKHGPELAGRHVRLTVTASPSGEDSEGSFREASGHSLMRHAGMWQGDDLEECLAIVYQTRGQVEFSPNLFDLVSD